MLCITTVNLEMRRHLKRPLYAYYVCIRRSYAPSTISLHTCRSRTDDWTDWSHKHLRSTTERSYLNVRDRPLRRSLRLLKMLLLETIDYPEYYEDLCDQFTCRMDNCGPIGITWSLLCWFKPSSFFTVTFHNASQYI